ncbi:MAG TPA: hypothetical protein VM370_08995 [Candidatus Thermoplasmatota archaeon]|nr:hypothetical protein [Candidatus Thermoplasmatota archaeon]
MATSWAVGSATMLGLTAAALVLGAGVHGSEVWFLFFGVIPLVAVWAYAISMAAHGSRTALVALALYALAGSIAALYLEWRVEAVTSGARLGAALAVATAILGALALWAILDEARIRGGPVHVMTVLALLLPIAPTAYCLWAARLLTALSGA